MYHLHPDRAAEAVMNYLDQGKDDRVRNYLQYYPIDHQKPEVLKAVYKTRGVPNQRAVPFYDRLERGIIWTFRRALFAPELDSFDPERFDLWERWLHRCFDLRIIQGIAHIYIHPFHVIEEPQRSLIHSLKNPNRVQIIERDGRWAGNMEALLQKFTTWD